MFWLTKIFGLGGFLQNNLKWLFIGLGAAALIGYIFYLRYQLTHLIVENTKLKMIVEQYKINNEKYNIEIKSCYNKINLLLNIMRYYNQRRIFENYNKFLSDKNKTLFKEKRGVLIIR